MGSVCSQVNTVQSSCSAWNMAIDLRSDKHRSTGFCSWDCSHWWSNNHRSAEWCNTQYGIIYGHVNIVYQTNFFVFLRCTEESKFKNKTLVATNHLCRKYLIHKIIIDHFSLSINSLRHFSNAVHNH